LAERLYFNERRPLAGIDVREPQARTLLRTVFLCRRDICGLSCGRERPRSLVSAALAPWRCSYVTLLAVGENAEIKAQNYLSLASLNYSRGRAEDSLRLLLLAKSLQPHDAKTRFLLGKLYSEKGETVLALDEFLRARELDPFYEDIHKHLGLLYSSKMEFREALKCFIDAYILSGGGESARNSYYRQQISLLLQKIGSESKSEYEFLFSERKQKLTSLADSLSQTSPQNVFESSSLDLPNLLKQFPVMRTLGNPELEILATMTSERSVKKEDVIFHEQDLSENIYFIHRGSIRIVKSTPFGEQVLCSLFAGEFFGEMDFIDSMQCSADAIASEDSSLLCMAKEKLEEFFAIRRDIAVQFYWHFWRTLSKRIRESNELLKSFFLEEEKSDREIEVVAGGPGETVTVDLQKKMAVLNEKGLSSSELALLASFSTEQFFRAGQSIFLEGDEGDKLYIVLDGQVRISKFIPGGGEEALAFLGKGDFFGEMALIDQAPRSADAKAHTDVIVLPVESGLLTDVLARDVNSSFQFLNILCKILSRRLREINLKIYQWRIMTGRF
jgi:CRP-like cAMP-binding protein